MLKIWNEILGRCEDLASEIPWRFPELRFIRAINKVLLVNKYYYYAHYAMITFDSNFNEKTNCFKFIDTKFVLTIR